MNKEIALFDFDGTITSKDTMLVFLRHLAGANRYHTSMLALSPVFAALTLGLMSNQRAKEILLTRFIGGMEERSLVEACKEFTANILPGIIRPKAMACIREHQQRGTEVVVVSAAPHYWVSGWCLEHDIALLATHLEVVDGRMTGRIRGRNCHGEEKVRRIREAYTLSVHPVIHAYGDTASDRPMLSLAQQAHYKPFR
jgi:phosphatidylglycerophosphatase C